jgi:hypothetical protein
MSKENILAKHIISSGNLIMLRKWSKNDSNHFARWKAQGEWLLFDAPWENSIDE